jgi:hypothetical protein
MLGVRRVQLALDSALQSTAIRSATVQGEQDRNCERAPEPMGRSIFRPGLQSDRSIVGAFHWFRREQRTRLPSTQLLRKVAVSGGSGSVRGRGRIQNSGVRISDRGLGIPELRTRNPEPGVFQRGFAREDFASLTNRPRARRRPRARAARPRLSSYRAPGINKDQSARPVS